MLWLLAHLRSSANTWSCVHVKWWHHNIPIEQSYPEVGQQFQVFESHKKTIQYRKPSIGYPHRDLICHQPYYTYRPRAGRCPGGSAMCFDIINNWNTDILFENESLSLSPDPRSSLTYKHTKWTQIRYSFSLPLPLSPFPNHEIMIVNQLHLSPDTAW